MATDRDLSHEMRRWLRVGAFTLTALGPVINTLGERLRARMEARGQQPQEVEQKTNEQLDPQERLVALGTALAETLAELRTHPYSQTLARQGEHLAEELMDRGRKLSRTVIERSSDASQQLLKRGKKTTKQWSKSKARIKKELRKRKNQQTRALRSNMFWLAFICSAGLTAAAVAIYLYIQRRNQQRETYSQPIELLQDDRWNGAALKEQASMTQSSSEARRDSGISNLGNRLTEQAIPEDATVIGVVSTRLYYPIEVPLERLAVAEDDTGAGITVVYFASEDEAQARGFTAASAQ